MIWIGCRRGYARFRKQVTSTDTALKEIMVMQSSLPQAPLLEETKIISTERRRILVVGLIQSLNELVEHERVLASLQQLCALYQERSQETTTTTTTKKTMSGWVDVHIVYQQADSTELQQLQSRLTDCHRTYLIRESDLLEQSDQGTVYWKHRFPEMNRFERLASLRSLQRQQIILQNVSTTTSTATNNNDNDSAYNAVLNFDADILQFPPLATVVQALETASSSSPRTRSDNTHNINDNNNNNDSGYVICANGYERWTLPVLGTFYFYYDTFASIDATGVWYYTEHVQKWWHILFLSQSVLFHDIIVTSSSSSIAAKKRPSSMMEQQQQQLPLLWPMQSCFGGLTVYDFVTWSSPDCDYDRHNIRLRVHSSSRTSSTRTTFDKANNHDRKEEEDVGGEV